MPDIAMCMNINCPVADKCYRFTAEPSPYWQSYMNYIYGENGCDAFWPNEGME